MATNNLSKDEEKLVKLFRNYQKARKAYDNSFAAQTDLEDDKDEALQILEEFIYDDE